MKRNSVNIRRSVVEKSRKHVVTAHLDEDRVKEEKPVVERSSFRRDRIGSVYVKANYLIVALMSVAMIANAIGHAIIGDYGLIFTNLLFLFLYTFAVSYWNPLNYASDNKNYFRGKFNVLYKELQEHIVPALLGRMGKHLNSRPRTTLIAAFLITLVGSITATLFYNSSFEILALPILVIYIARVFASNSFRSELGVLNLFKWLLFLMFIINAIMSVFWRTSIDYSLFVIISVMNSTSVWFKNTYIYTYSDVD